MRAVTAVAASAALPRAVRTWRERRASASALLTEPSGIHTYEEGADAAAVPLGDGVVAEAGKPVFSSADAVHDQMGWASTASNTGGRLIYANPATSASSGSVYVTPHSVSPSSAATLVALMSAASPPTTLARVRLRSDGRFDVLDAAGTRLAMSRPVVKPGERFRLDWQQQLVGDVVQLTVWAYLSPNVEGWRPDVALTADTTSSSPPFISLGEDRNRKVTIGFDTYREYSQAGRPAPHAPPVGVAAIHDYDEGPEGATVSAGDDGVRGVRGSPLYSSAAAMHGPLGVDASGGGTLVYDNPYPPGSTGSIYVRPVLRGGSSSRIISIQNGATTLAQIKLTSHGMLSIADAADAVLDQTSSRTHSNVWTRIDWQAVWDGTDLSVSARYFRTGAESAIDYTEIAATLPVSEVPDTLEIGSQSPGWHLQLDTLRTVGSVSDWPSPFDPTPVVRPAGMALWAGDATQKTVKISAYTNDTTSVGLNVATRADMSDAVLWPSAPPDDAGWNTWAVTGLRPGSQYYYRLSDTPVGGAPQPIGDVAKFKTLQAVGVPCTIRIAVGSCEQTTPAKTAAFDDIAAWGPDRTVHLGDLGYPNDLSEDPLTHTNNWARNSTDPGIHKIQSIACMDYLVSDHDGNGTGSSNRPNYHDVVTAANITAWRQVVPARMADKRVQPRGRWRSDVEGNVRFVKLDTRALDKTDTTAVATDPRSPDSTMLGPFQLTWLNSEIDAAALARQLVVIFSDCAWNGTSPGPPIPASYADKWPSYIYERDLISDYAAARGAQLFIVFGDSHGLQQDDGTHEKNGFASICCGPLDQDLHMHYQDSYQWSYPADITEGGGPYRHAQQYQRLTISQQPGSSTVTVTAEARDCTRAVPGTPLTVRTLTKTYTL
ncbi:MAG: alkaline phosphatase D family protein [Nocardioidaceae bacterium]